MSTRILVTGATGYVGGRLVPELLDAGMEVRCLVRSPAKLDDRPWTERVEVVQGDVTDASTLAPAMAGVDAAYFLVHGMGTASDFSARDREAAATFREFDRNRNRRSLFLCPGNSDQDRCDRVTNYRIDYERGLLSKNIDTLELWHVEDLRFHQSLVDRLLGVGNVTVISHDETMPHLVLRVCPTRGTFTSNSNSG